MSVSIGAIGAVNAGQSLYSVLSPYLNGVVRTSDAATVAQADAASQTTNAAVTQSNIAAQGAATAAATAAPFDNPAISAIGTRIALGQALSATTGVTPDALLSSSTINGTSTNALNATTNLNTLATFNDINDQNSVSTLNSLTAFNSLNSLTNTTQLNGTATASPLSQTSLDATNPDLALVNSTSSFTQPTTNISPTASVLTGDSGTVVQSNAAALLATSIIPQSSAFAQPVTSLIPPAAIVAPIQSLAAVA